MTLFATKGTSWLMTILIWFLSLFGINIGGGNEPILRKTEYYYIPEGASLVMEDETIYGPEKIAKNITLENGTVYTYGDYTYTKSPYDYWMVKVIDKTQKFYPSVILSTSIVDKDGKELRKENTLFGVKDYALYECYKDCVNLVDAPDILQGCINLNYAFEGCTNLVNPPQIQGNPVVSRAFKDCPNVQFPDKYHITFESFYLSYSQKTDSWNFVQQPRDSTDNGREKAFVSFTLSSLESLEYKYCGRNINVEEIVLQLDDFAEKVGYVKGTLVLKPIPEDPLSAYFTIVYRNDLNYKTMMQYCESINSNICGYDIKTDNVNIPDCCVLELVPGTDNVPEHYKIVKQQGSVYDILKYFDAKNCKFAGTPVDLSELKTNNVDIPDRCVLEFVPETDDAPEHYKVTKQQGTACDIIEYFRKKNYKFAGTPVDLSGISEKFSYEQTDEIPIRFTLTLKFKEGLSCYDIGDGSNDYYAWNIEVESGEKTYIPCKFKYSLKYADCPIDFDGFVDDFEAEMYGVNYVFVQPKRYSSEGAHWKVVVIDAEKAKNSLILKILSGNTGSTVHQGGYPISPLVEYADGQTPAT